VSSEEPRLVGGRYRLDRRIGSGAMGVVWQAYDERLRRAVAVKQLRLEPGLDPTEADEARQRAMREGRIAARLHHPNAVSVFDVVDEDDAPWLVMEYVPSRSLAQEMSQRKLLPPEEVGRIGAQVAHALVAAHARPALQQILFDGFVDDKIADRHAAPRLAGCRRNATQK